jgi:hypothetical protein
MWCCSDDGRTPLSSVCLSQTIEACCCSQPTPSCAMDAGLSYGDVYKDRNEADICIIIVHLPRFRRRSSMGQ